MQHGMLGTETAVKNATSSSRNASDQLPSLDSPELGPGWQFGPFELLGRIAKGGMAEIYLARQRPAPRVERLLVVKTILPAIAEEDRFVRMFEREARIAMRLKHPAICPVYEFGCQDGRYYLAMEWVEGASLLDLLRRAKKGRRLVPVPIVLQIIANVAEALDSAHRALDDQGRPLGLVHRDVSPHNVLVSWDGMVRLLDFGVAKVQSESTQARDGLLVGKFGYLSPEQCRREPVDGRCDVFALGVVLYEALTGRRLYRRQTEIDALRAIVDDPVPSVRLYRPDLPRQLDAIVRRALAKRPSERFTSAGNMARALRQHLNNQGTFVTSAQIGEVMRTHFAAEIHRRIPELRTDTELLRLLPAASSPADYSHVAPRPSPDDEPSLPAPVEARSSYIPPAALAHAWRCHLADIAVKVSLLKSQALNAMGRQPGAVMAAGVAAAVVVLISSLGLIGEPGDAASESPEPRGVERPGAGAPPRSPDTARAASESPAATEAVDVEQGERAADDPAAGSSEEVADPQPRGSATLHLNTRPWSIVYAGDRLLGATPIAKARVPAGILWLRFEDRDGKTHRRRVNLAADEEMSLYFELDSDGP
jgi:eukaryotic-like serine/threonine-protein kinase